MSSRPLLIVLALLLVGCSGSSEAPESSRLPPVEADREVSSDALEQTESTPPTSVESAATLEPSDPTPVRSEGDPPEVDTDFVSDSVWISRAAMSSTSIEMTWSDFEGAVEYQLHRVPWVSNDRPPPEALTDESLIHVADDLGRFVDDGVEAGTRYWYGLRALTVDGVPVAYGWHRADAITDTEPPTPVPELSAVLNDEGVLVTWDLPTDNYELSSYQILRAVDEGEFEVVGNSYDVNRRAFIDDDLPANGRVSYEVVAWDFHWNKSEPVRIDVQLSG